MKLNNVKVPFLVRELHKFKIQLTYVGIDLGQPSQNRVPSSFSRVIGRFNDVGMDEICLRGLDDATQEEIWNPTPDQTIRENVSNIIKLYFEQQSVITQAQILHGLIKHKNLSVPQSCWVLRRLKIKMHARM